MDAYQSLFGTVTVRTATIGNLETFILNNVPYGQVDGSKDIQRGTVEFDGPQAPGFDGITRPLLQWHFGGIAYPISEAIRIQYSYEIWATTTTAYAGFLFGFQHNVIGTPVIANPRIAAAAKPATPLLPDAFTFIKQLLDAQPTTLVTGSVGGGNSEGQDQSVTERITNGQPPAGDAASVPADIDALVDAQFPDDAQRANWRTQKSRPSLMFFDGVAKDYDSHNPFVYTQAALFNDKEKYSQVLWWYFGGKARRITKAIRIPLTPAAVNADEQLSLFIGFAGPGDCPSGC